jgi:hypothetical protein
MVRANSYYGNVHENIKKFKRKQADLKKKKIPIDMKKKLIKKRSYSTVA